jgi:hypothetical protein
MDPNGSPASQIWAMVDDCFIHSPTKRKCRMAFAEFMEHMLRLGFICQNVKTSPPAQVQKFCSLLLDTQGMPKLQILAPKVSRSLATLQFVIKMNARRTLSRLMVAAMGGLLQSLVNATPSRLGQTCLRGVCDNVHHACPLTGRDLHCTTQRQCFGGLGLVGGLSPTKPWQP